MPKHLGCNYEAPTFGARYPDGTCIDGFMWDLDSCDEPGGALTSGGDMPCPWCNTAAHIEWMDRRSSGNARQRRKAARALIPKIRTWADQRSTFAPAGRCLGKTAGGHPKHPLARGKHKVPKNAPLIPWST